MRIFLQFYLLALTSIIQHVLDLSINVQTLFNLNNELGLVTHENWNTVIEVLNIDSIEKNMK